MGERYWRLALCKRFYTNDDSCTFFSCFYCLWSCSVPSGLQLTFWGIYNFFKECISKIIKIRISNVESTPYLWIIQSKFSHTDIALSWYFKQCNKNSPFCRLHKSTFLCQYKNYNVNSAKELQVLRYIFAFNGCLVDEWNISLFSILIQGIALEITNIFQSQKCKSANDIGFKAFIIWFDKLMSKHNYFKK